MSGAGPGADEHPGDGQDHPDGPEADGHELDGPELLALRGRGLRLDHRRAVVFGPLDLDVPAGDLLLVQGAAGSGKTALLLALAGRLRLSGGDLQVHGLPLPRRARAVRHRVALAEMGGVNDLDDALTVEQHVAERLVIHQPWWKPWVSARRVQEVLDRVDTALEVNARRVQDEVTSRHRQAQDVTAGVDRLRRKAFVSDLSPLERFVLGVVLALLGRPDVLVVDDVDALRNGPERRQAWSALLALDGYQDEDGHHRLTVVVTTQDTGEPPPPGTTAAEHPRRVHLLRLATPADAAAPADAARPPSPGAP